MKIKIISIAVLIICYSCNAQQKKVAKECYKTSWAKWIENKLPESICVQKNEMIYNFFNKFDFNSDGLKDVAIEKGGDSLVNGLQPQLVIYQKVNDSTFVKFKELDNIYPLWFEDYDPSVKVNDLELDKIKEYYEGNPLRKINLDSDKIILNLNGDAVTEYVLTYIYSNEKKDWLLANYIEYDLYNNTRTPYQTNRIGTSISEFSFIEYLNGEY